MKEEIMIEAQTPPIALYRFLVRRTGSNFNAVTLNRLFMNKVNWPPLSLSSRKRMYEVPALKVIAPRFIETAHARIEMAGGECLTFD
ncbi:hypothetical protein Ahy_B04g072771 [Arachis hypogaea]|uniref:Large ribosomal subunit protein uL15/eL18 domain-containing protein n=1 Tax=Arachis hypogaea TaxID=3818 RepID=A0A444ZNT7_ARAHY|nr:hypothetical protein Ahy_B04g072771 [Arachis hypogaea]